MFVTSQFTKLFYCERANIAHIQSGDTLHPSLTAEYCSKGGHALYADAVDLVYSKQETDRPIAIQSTYFRCIIILILKVPMYMMIKVHTVLTFNT